jgi:ATP-binding cassette subfamily B protein
MNMSAFVAAIIATEHQLASIGTIYLVINYTLSVVGQLWTISQVTRNYIRIVGDAGPMIAMLDEPIELNDVRSPEAALINHGKITFTDVVFKHDGSRQSIFNKLNLRIKPGEKVGLVGRSGSGKTTLTRLLLRFSDIQEGQIAIDGQDISTITQDDLRRHIAYVPQEPLLFHRSIRENIAYGSPEASNEAVEGVAKMASAHNFIVQLPQGYDTPVGERGVKLSGGQRQRIAIARAMLKNAPILALDEATSALDSESEALIQDALWKLMEGRTAIVIAHRLSTIQKMDRIIVLDDGIIVEEGSHKELVGKKDGTYAKLWARQSGGFIED